MENWWRLSHLFVTVFLSNFSELMVNPAIPDVTLVAVCPGQDECSLAIYLTGFQQAIAGVGSVIMMPLIGNLSDAYGRKRLLTIPLVISIIPLVILAWKRTTNFFYAYYAIKTLTSMVTQGGIVCLALAYLADNVSEGKRISAFGILSGVINAAYVSGTFTARLLSTTQIFQVSAALSIGAAVYMMVFLKETSQSTHQANALEQPMLKDEESCKASTKTEFVGNIPSPRIIYRMLKSSVTFSLASSVAFFNSLAEAGLMSYLLYFLKARFHFQKDQFADVLLIAYVGATISTMLFMPTLGPLIGEELLLSVGLFSGFLNDVNFVDGKRFVHFTWVVRKALPQLVFQMFLDSIAWARWVPYAASANGVFLFMTSPSLRSIVSKQVGPKEQGLAQGCILGMTSFANVISPLIYGPLSALFFSEKSPFHFQGFSILCVGLAWVTTSSTLYKKIFLSLCYEPS